MVEMTIIARLKEIEASIPPEWTGELKRFIHELDEELPGYHLDAHRPDHVDTCRGCVMGRSGSDHQTFTSRDELAFARRWARLLHFNKTREQYYAPYEIEIFLNGQAIWEGDRAYDIVWSLAQDELRNLEDAERRHKEAEANRREAMRKEQEDRKKLGELIAQYGIPNDFRED